MRNKVETILSSFKTKSILVIGDIMLDEYIWGNVYRISPEAPVPIMDVTKEEYKLGGAANVAKNLKTLGAKTVYLAGVVGVDNGSDTLLGLLKETGIDTLHMCFDQNRKTTVKTRIMAGHQHVVRIDRETRDEITEDHIRSILNISKNIDAIIISDYAKGVINKEIMESIVKLGKPVIVDPKKKNFILYNNVDVITPNLQELSEGSGKEIKTPNDIDKAAEILFEKLNCKNLLITKGSEGMSFFEKSSGKKLDIPTYARKVFDVTGAGDTVISTFALSLVSGADMELACKISNAAAGIVVGEMGAISPTPDEILDYFSYYYSDSPHSER
jgi:rfaE bifunctional protein kinase chain/domain